MYPPILAAGFALTVATMVLALRPRPGGNAPSTTVTSEILIRRIVVGHTNLLATSMAATLLAAGGAMWGVFPVWVGFFGVGICGHFAISTATDVFKFHSAMAEATRFAGKPSNHQVDKVEMTVQAILALATVPVVIWAVATLLLGDAS